MEKSPDEQPFLAAYKLWLAKLTLVAIAWQLLSILELWKPKKFSIHQKLETIVSCNLKIKNKNT